MICAIHYSDDRDDLEAVDYQCSSTCMQDTLAEVSTEAADSPNMAGETQDGRISWGGWPGGAETDHAVYCSACGVKLWDGLEDEQPTDRPDSLT